jgi:hypothetical protein
VSGHRFARAPAADGKHRANACCPTKVADGAVIAIVANRSVQELPLN